MPKSSILLHRITTNTHPTTTSPFSHLRHNIPSLPPSSPPDFKVPDDVVRYHAQTLNSNQCSSTVIQEISAPIELVWSVVRRFDAPQLYKHFIRQCDVISGNGDVGTLRRVRVVSGLPAATSDERLEILDDLRHVISFSIIGGDHRLSNYQSVTSLHPIVDDSGEASTIVVESYVVDTPAGNTKEETCVFVDTIVKCNMQSLAQIAENLVRRRREREEKENENENKST